MNTTSNATLTDRISAHLTTGALTIRELADATGEHWVTVGLALTRLAYRFRVRRLPDHPHSPGPGRYCLVKLEN